MRIKSNKSSANETRMSWKCFILAVLCCLVVALGTATTTTTKELLECRANLTAAIRNESVFLTKIETADYIFTGKIKEFRGDRLHVRVKRAIKGQLNHTVDVLVNDTCGFYVRRSYTGIFLAMKESGKVLMNFGPVPLTLANLDRVNAAVRVTEFIQRLYDFHKEAKYVGIFDFSFPTIMIHDYEIAKDITVKKFDYFVNHRGFVDPINDPLVGNNVFSLHNNKWREVRSLLGSSFTSSKMKTMFHLMSDCADDFTNYFIEKTSKKTYEINSKDVFSRYTNDVIATCAYGLKIDSLRDPTNQFYIFGRKAASLDGIISIKLFFNRSFPRISKLFSIKLFPAKSENFFAKLVEDTIARRDREGIFRADLVQLMMETRKAEDGNRRALTIKQMAVHAFGFFFAGFEAPSSLMCFVAHLLAANEDVQIKLRKEVDVVFEECNGQLNYEAINSMVYLDAVIKETLRIYPINAFLDRVCNAPFELPPAEPGKKPVMLKPGDCVWIPVFPFHRDPKYYENPEIFDPERFIKNGKIVVNPALPFMPFGQGPRRCLASRFALLELKILFVKLLRKISIRPSKRMINPMEFSESSFTMSAKGGFWVEFERRKI